MTDRLDGETTEGGPMRAVMTLDPSATEFVIRLPDLDLRPGDEVYLAVREIPDGLSAEHWPVAVVVRRVDGTEQRLPLETVSDLSELMNPDGCEHA